jgi:hypothetical protein
MRENLVLVDLVSGAVTSDTASASAEVDLGPYTAVGRQCLALWAPATYGIVSTDSTTDQTFNAKIQESATTVDSDFSDVTSGAFTQTVGSDTAHAWQSLKIQPLKRYLRAYTAIAGGGNGTLLNYIGLVLQGRFDT